jgi:hypothetical protein
MTKTIGIKDANPVKVQNRTFFNLLGFINFFTKKAPIPVIKINNIIFLCFKVIRQIYEIFLYKKNKFVFFKKNIFHKKKGRGDLRTTVGSPVREGIKKSPN